MRKKKTNESYLHLPNSDLNDKCLQFKRSSPNKKIKVNQKSFPKIIILNSLPLIIISRFMAENIENNKSMVK
jgi:hypothetical protein